MSSPRVETQKEHQAAFNSKCTKVTQLIIQLYSFYNAESTFGAHVSELCLSAEKKCVIVPSTAIREYRLDLTKTSDSIASPRARVSSAFASDKK
jgi:hypothetical protein